MIFASAMCWVNEEKKLVLVCWVLWVAGFFALPFLFGQAWPFLVFQTLLAIVLVFRWKYADFLP